MKRRTTLTGPRSASVAATIPNAIVHAHLAPWPRSSSDSAAAADEMMISSNVAQPQHCSALRTVGPYEPTRPSGARISTIPGTRASAPIRPADASIAFPTSPPRSVATIASRSESAGTSSAPTTMTRSETPSEPQSRPWSSRPSTRSRSGTGSIPSYCMRSSIAPFAGITRIRFVGSVLSLAAPRCVHSSRTG
jgi:hypothetical protein